MATASAIPHSSLQALHARFKQLEFRWHSSLTPTDLALLTAGHTLSQPDLFHHGEFAFLILGIKPCMLVSFPSIALNARFRNEVCLPALEGAEGFSCATIEHDLRSPEMEFRGAVVVMNERHEQHRVVQKVFLNEGVVHVEEEEVAVALDYPGKLPRTEEEAREMVEVGYMDCVSPYNPVLLTTYAALKPQMAVVHWHFIAYRAATLQLGIDLKLSISHYHDSI